MKNHLYLLLLFLSPVLVTAQQVSLYTQFLGKYDFTMIGNTLNIYANGTNVPCVINTSSSATLTMLPGQNIEAAYLYWGGSGSASQFDFNIRLNGVNITPDRTFASDITGRPVSGAFADVTTQVVATGNGNYTVSDFDLTGVIGDYCANGTNFGGWSILIIYEDLNLGYNLVNVYDGFTRVDQQNTFVQLQLDNLNVLHLAGNKVGFLAWEGDENIAVQEYLRINNNIVSNPPLNPANNVFNGTNSFTGSNTLYNMDLDFFDISSYTSVGDNSMTVSIESHQDAIILNNMVVVLNSEVPDATIEGDAVSGDCDDRDISVSYTVSNLIATDILPAGTQIAFYADDLLVGQSATVNDIPIGGSESGNITLTIPESVPNSFTLKMVVDDDGTGTGAVLEFNEENNEFEIEILLGVTPTVNPYDNLQKCDTNNDGFEIFDLTIVGGQMLDDQTDVLVRYYTDQSDANAGNNNNINNPGAYTNQSSPQTIYVRMEDPANCFIVASFTIEIVPPALLSYELPDLEQCSPNLAINGITVDLTQNIDAILNGADPNDFDISFHTTQVNAMSGASPLPNPVAYVNTTNPETIWVRMVDEDGCVLYGSFDIIIVPAAEMDYSLPDLEFCSPDMDATGVIINLTENQDAILNGNNPDDYTITYHTALNDAINGLNPIATPENYQNMSSPQTIWVRMISEDDCVLYGSFTITFSLPSEMDYILPDLEFCSEDQVLTGHVTNLTLNETAILNGDNPNDFVITYHLNMNDARNGINPIANPTNYINTASPETIWARKIDNNNCVHYGSFDIIYHPAPVAFNAEIEECSMFGPAEFDLTNLNGLVVGNTSGLTFTYYLTMNDAVNQTNPLSSPYTPNDMIVTIFVRIEDGNTCFSIVEAVLESIVNTAELTDTYYECDSPWEPSDGQTTFDLTQLYQQLLNSLGLTSADITFHTTTADAISGNNPVSNPYTNEVNPQTLYARVVGTDGNCGGIVTFNIEVLPVPEFDLPDYLAFCSYDAVKSYTFNLPFHSYQWTNPSGEVVSNSSTVEFDEEGEWTLEIRDAADGCPAKRSVEVIIDNPPTILDIKVDGQTVTVFATGGYVPYQYSHNNGLSWINYHIFDLPGGLYDLLVKSKYGCISDSKFFGVLGIPNFISPNGDGKNDFWYVRGLEAYPDAHVKIFDRYGKMFVDRKLGPDFRWDGRYKGEPVQSGDYWYIISFEDGKQLSGHISVRNY